MVGPKQHPKWMLLLVVLSLFALVAAVMAFMAFVVMKPVSRVAEAVIGGISVTRCGPMASAECLSGTADAMGEPIAWIPSNDSWISGGLIHHDAGIPEEIIGEGQSAEEQLASVGGERTVILTSGEGPTGEWGPRRIIPTPQGPRREPWACRMQVTGEEGLVRSVEWMRGNWFALTVQGPPMPQEEFLPLARTVGYHRAPGKGAMVTSHLHPSRVPSICRALFSD